MQKTTLSIIVGLLLAGQAVAQSGEMEDETVVRQGEDRVKVLYRPSGFQYYRYYPRYPAPTTATNPSSTGYIERDDYRGAIDKYEDDLYADDDKSEFEEKSIYDGRYPGIGTDESDYKKRYPDLGSDESDYKKRYPGIGSDESDYRKRYPDLGTDDSDYKKRYPDLGSDKSDYKKRYPGVGSDESDYRKRYPTRDDGGS